MTEVESRYSRNEELANALSHLAGALLATVALVLLVVKSARIGNAWHIVSTAVFGVTMIILFFSSTMTHWLKQGKAKDVFFTIDQIAIFTLIAGTYTPITLGVLKGAWGWSLLGAVWVLAVVGIVLKLVGGIKRPWLSTGLYLLMGWLVLFAIRPLWLVMPLTGLLWLAAGGLAYTIGTAFYAADERVKYAHFVWHLWVMAGTGCHFFAVLTSV